MFEAILSPLMNLFATHPGLGQWYTPFARWVFPLLALVLLLIVIRYVLKAENPAVFWATVGFPYGADVPLTIW